LPLILVILPVQKCSLSFIALQGPLPVLILPDKINITLSTYSDEIICKLPFYFISQFYNGPGKINTGKKSGGKQMDQK
jgi:hypothetical protein